MYNRSQSLLWEASSCCIDSGEMMTYLAASDSSCVYVYSVDVKYCKFIVPLDSEVVKSSETRIEGSSKRARDELESDKSKKQADGKFKRYLSMIKMLQNIDREDSETLWKLVKAKHGNTRPDEDYEVCYGVI
ncbi:hypothetical protein Tco_0600038 [Tanacetum coccineum]|uniref:Uncharacterized protein n=1 Tax=Tanacetum coccineum TaxID=301880 RepID=A0ABQ4WAN6_9ASTR